MRRTEMQVNVAGIRRNIKNIAHNYSDAQKKVREATSNDQWGPSSTLMTEISDLTYNVVAFSEIMHMVWKRLNDHGRNWRHVYKALLLLEYLIKTGTEKVAQQCRENIFAIQTLKDFQYLEEGRDQGNNVREKARQLVELLKDDERLKNERARAIKAKATNHSGFGSDGGMNTPPGDRYPNYTGDKYKTDWGSRDATGQSQNSDQDQTDLPRDIEVARPQTAGEEELQLQLALAMSREEAEQEEQKKRSDEVRLQLALSESQQDFKTHEKPMFDLLDVNLDVNKSVDPWGMPQQNRPQHPNPSNIGWSQSAVSSPPPLGLPPPSASALAGAAGGAAADPWSVPAAGAAAAAPSSQHHSNNNGRAWSPASRMAGAVGGIPLQETAIRHDPWSPSGDSSSGADMDEFDVITNRNKDDHLLNNDRSNNASAGANDPFELNLLGDLLSNSATNGSGPSPSTGATKKTPQSFLGENSALVNLDNLVTSKPALPILPTNPTHHQQLIANPFSDTPTLLPQQPPPPSRQVFTQPPAKQPTMNQIKQQSPFLDTHNTTTTNHLAGHTSPHFNGGGGLSDGLFGVAPLQPAQQQHSDPWAPVPAAASAGATGSPWIKPGEQAVNPFLS